MAFPKDLRQKMINLMYLVLMAMLAINIDPAALEGYRTINDGMKASYNAFDAKNKATVTSISTKAEEDGKPEQQLYAEQASKVVGISSGMDTYINQLISDIRAEASNKDGEFQIDSKDPSAKLMISDDITSGRAAQLKEEIKKVTDNYRTIVNNSPLSDEKKTALINNFSLKVPNDDAIKAIPENKDEYGWEQWTFKGKPAIALEAILNQFKNDAKATEGQILDAFAVEMDAEKIDIPYDVYSLAVIPSSTYVERGDKFTAKINVGQSSSQMQDLTRIYVNGRQVPINNEGFAVYTANASSIGDKTLKDVYAIVKNPQTGEETRVDMKDPLKYRVINPSKPSAAVSADKMNVFYAGLTNPVSVSASGMGQVQANCTGCASFSANSTGGYDAKVSGSQVGKEVTVNVSIDGQPVESKKFRVMKVPDPAPKLGVKRSGTAFTTGELAAQSFVQADLENFVFDAKFQVVSYDMWFLTSRGNKKVSGSGPQLTSEMKSYLGRVSPGAQIVINNVKAKGPDGSTRNIGAAIYAVR